MATFTFTIPDDQAERVVNAVCNQNNWSAALGITKVQFFKKWVIARIKQEVRDFELQSAMHNTRQTVDNSVGAIDVT